MTSAGWPTVATRVPPHVLAALEAHASERGATKSQVLNGMIEAFLVQAGSLEGDGATHARPQRSEADSARQGNRENRRVEVLRLFARAGLRGLTAPECVELLPNRAANGTPRRVQDLLDRGMIAPILTHPMRSGPRARPVACLGAPFARTPRPQRDGETYRYDDAGRHVATHRPGPSGRPANVYAITPVGIRALTEATS